MPRRLATMTSTRSWGSVTSPSSRATDWALSPTSTRVAASTASTSPSTVGPTRGVCPLAPRVHTRDVIGRHGAEVPRQVPARRRPGPAVPPPVADRGPLRLGDERAPYPR